MYAVAEISGKQYFVEEGKTVEVDKLAAEKGAAVSFETVCLVKDASGQVKVGQPYVKGAVVKATVQDVVKGEKIVVFTYRKRKDSKRKKGHRQQYSVVRIEKIQA